MILASRSTYLGANSKHLSPNLGFLSAWQKALKKVDIPGPNLKIVNHACTHTTNRRTNNQYSNQPTQSQYNQTTMAAVPTLSRNMPGNSSASSFGRRGRNSNHSSSSSLDRVKNSVESLLSRASRDNLRSSSSSGGQSRNAPGANATFDIVDVPTGGGNSALFLRSGATGDSTATKAAASATATATSSSTTVASLSGDNKSTNDAAASATHSAVTANVRYRNDDGRAAVLRVAQTVNHDFGALTSIMNVTLGSIEALDVLSANPDIEWVDRNGAVFFVQPFGKS